MTDEARAGRGVILSRRSAAKDLSRLALVALTILVATLAISSVRLDSATADEGAHIASGLIKLRHGWLSFYPGQGPLMNVITVLPLAGVTLPESWRTDTGPDAHWRVGHAVLYESGNDPDRVLFLARLPTIALLLILCVAVYFFVAEHSGSRGWALVAFAMTGLCPNLLAHGRLATVDLGAATFVFIAASLFLRLLEKPSIAIGIAAGAFTALAILAKTSALILGPFFAIVLLLHVMRTRAWPPLIVPLLVSVVAAIVVFAGVYLALASEAWLQAHHPDVPRIAVPFLEYRAQIVEIERWYAKGHERPQFLLGEFSRTGWPHYFLVAFLLKTPLAAQLAFVAAIVAAVRRGSPALRACVIFVVLYFAVASGSRVNLGIRYILQIYPFVYAAIALTLAKVVINRGRTIVAGVLLAWHCLSSVIAWPGYISYFNELIGSHRNADRFLIDSNLDWGQDLRRLRRWCDANGVDSIRLDYFGAGEPRHEFGARAERWPAPRPQPLPKGWFAVSRHFYRISFDEEVSPVDYDTYLAYSRARYVTTVGGSIDVYRVD